MKHGRHVKAVAVVGAVEARAEAEDAAGTAAAAGVDAAVVDRAAAVAEAVTNPAQFASAFREANGRDGVSLSAGVTGQLNFQA
jgi:hypothetical protein